MFPPIERANAWIHHIAQILANAEHLQPERSVLACSTGSPICRHRNHSLTHSRLRSLIMWSRRPTALPQGSFIAITCHICQRPIMTWNSASGPYATMNDEPQAAKPPFPPLWYADRCAWSQPLPPRLASSPPKTYVPEILTSGIICVNNSAPASTPAANSDAFAKTLRPT